MLDTILGDLDTGYYIRGPRYWILYQETLILDTISGDLDTGYYIRVPM